MRYFVTVLNLVFGLALFSCSESTSPSDNPYVKVIAQMTSNTVSSSILSEKHPSLQAGDIDSIQIKDFRILLSRLKFQAVTGDNDPNEDEHEMKAGPFLLDLDSTGNSFQLAAGEIPDGSYEKIKFELHRFSSSETADWQNDGVFGDFATDDRFSVIISGTVFSSEGSEDFVFSGKPTANLMLKFEPEIVFEENGDYTIQLDIDPSLIFEDGNSFLDPTDNKDSNDIDNNVKDAFKSIKKK